ncbi:MAG: GWxTD domain-containing protein [Acidobacteria bacterium]|nr:GWxTD domain-containing protein [Acidobacteriota bacterium]
MDELIRLIHGAGCAALGRALAHSLWQGAALAAILALVNWRLGARARYGAACTALVVLLVSFVVTAVVCYDAPALGTFVYAPAAGVSRVFVNVSGTGVDWIPWLAPLWAAGVMLMSFRLAVGWLGARRLVRLAGPPLPSRWQQVALSLAAKMRVRPAFRLLESARVAGPAVIGWLRPAILVPAGALCGLSAEQLEAVLAHELAHLARRDALVNLLESVAEVALFYHPAVWWISSRIRREREHCCDDLAVAVCGSARLYAGALLRLEEARPARRALVFAAHDGDLVARIRRLLAPARAERVEWRSALSWLAGLLVVATLALAVTIEEPPPAPPAVPVAPAVPAAPAPPAAPAVAAKAAVGNKEHARRVEYANQRFGEGSTPGSQTERGRVYVSFGPPDEMTTHGDYEKWFYRRLVGVGNNVSFEFGLDRKPADLQARQEALRKQRDAVEAQLEMSLAQHDELRRLSEQERVKSFGDIEKARQAIEMLKVEIQSTAAELERLKAQQQLEKRR